MQPSQSRGCAFWQLPAELTRCCVCHVLSLVQRRHQRPGPEEQIARIHQRQWAEDWPILDNRIVDLQTTWCSFMVWPQMWILIALYHSFLWVKRSCGTDVRISKLLVPVMAEINSLKSIIWNVLSQILHMWPYASVSSCSGGLVLVASIMRDSAWREVWVFYIHRSLNDTVIGTSYFGGGDVRKDVSPPLALFQALIQLLNRGWYRKKKLTRCCDLLIVHSSFQNRKEWISFLYQVLCRISHWSQCCDKMPDKKQFEERRMDLHWFTVCRDLFYHGKESMVAEPGMLRLQSGSRERWMTQPMEWSLPHLVSAFPFQWTQSRKTPKSLFPCCF